MQSLGIGTTLGSSLTKQHNTIIISERQRALEKETNCMKKTKFFSNLKEQLSVTSTFFYQQFVLFAPSTENMLLMVLLTVFNKHNKPIIVNDWNEAVIYV